MIRPLITLGLMATLGLGLAACQPSTPSGDGSASSGATSDSASNASSSSSDMASVSSESLASSESASLPDFPHHDPMDLIAGSGQGYNESTLWAPNICFPLADTPAYANSQVYHPGGTAVPSNTNQCDPGNYSYPWQDNFCESRSWTNPLCTSGQGHQGQDIRPKTCAANTYWAVAAEDGTVTQIGSYTVAITSNATPHRIYRYLHMKSSSVQVHLYDHVVRGQKLGLVSNNLGIANGKPQYTTIHLHFEVRIAQAETLADGTHLAAQTFVPPYSSLVDAYRRKLGGDCPSVN